MIYAAQTLTRTTPANMQDEIEAAKQLGRAQSAWAEIHAEVQRLN